MKLSIGLKINFTVVAIVIVALVVIIITQSNNSATLLDKQVDMSSSLQLNAYHEYLDANYEEGIDEVKSGMNTLRFLLSSSGTAKISIGANDKPDIHFGSSVPSQGHIIVDRMGELFDCAATVLVRDNDDLVRVSTNLKKDDGSRAIGTNLDPKGAAYKALMEGKSLYTNTLLFGSDYLVGYEPIFNAEGKVVGAYFVGFKFEGLTGVGEQIKKTKFLENGFFALYDTTLQKVYAKTDDIDTAEIIKLITDHKNGTADGWELSSVSHEDSQYEIWCGYPISDYDKIVNETIFYLILLGIIILAVLIIIVSIMVRSVVTKPMKKAIKAAEMVASGELEGIDLRTNSKDEIEVLLRAFDVMVGSIENLVEDVQSMSKSAIDGKLSARADENKHKGAYKSLIVSTNELVSTLVKHLHDTVKYLNNIGKGEIPELIKTPLPGELEEVRYSINNCIEAMNYLAVNVNQIAAEASQGKLDFRADAKKSNGTWADILIGINGIVENADNIINDAGKTLSIMATGDLTPRITMNYAGKFGEMKDNINNLGNSLTDMISQLQVAIHTTASASAQISSTADTLAAATQEQSSQTDEVATAMEEMSRTVTDNAHSANRTADVARNSGEVATAGGKVVQQTVIKMREIADVVQQSAANITKLGESSKKIGEIIVVIEDIASQTNLLSLNAAIEAARAGEQGRGFAVVADSVGKLAISTASATKEISDMIKGIQTDTEAAVIAMERGTAEVHSGIELADNAGHSLQDILSGINELLDMVNQIAAASEQQSATSDEISKNVSSISKVTGDSARNVEDVAMTANELAKMTETLTSLVSQFKIKDTFQNHRALE